MAETQSQPFTMRKPGSGPKSVFAPRARYSPLTDTLLLYFYGGPEPAINIDVEDSSLYVMVDPDTYEIVGVHIQAFTRRFLPEHPHYRKLDAVKRLLSEGDDEPDSPVEDDALLKTLAEMVVGSLMFEHRLVAT